MKDNDQLLEELKYIGKTVNTRKEEKSKYVRRTRAHALAWQ